MFFNNYNKPGPGVEKRDPNTPRIKVFWEIFPRKLWDLFKLNILYIVASLPFIIITMLVAGVISTPLIGGISSTLSGKEVVAYDILIRGAVAFWFMVLAGLGPTTAGFIYNIREYACERHCWGVDDFFKTCKSNFKQSILLWIIDLAVLYVLTVSIRFYGQMGNAVFQYIIISVALIYVMMHTYIYQIMITFDLPLKHILKNSFLMTMGKAPVNLLILLCNIIIYMIIPIMVTMSKDGIFTTIIVLFAEVLFLPSITNFITSFYNIPILEKYISNDKHQSVES